MKRETASNNEKAATFVKKMREFVDEALQGKAEVPMRHGQVNVTAVAEKLGFARERFHSNKALAQEMARLLEFMGQVAITEAKPGHSNKEMRALEARVKTLEKALLLKTIELEAVREQTLRRDQAEEYLLRTGRVIHPYQRQYPNGSCNSFNN